MEAEKVLQDETFRSTLVTDRQGCQVSVGVQPARRSGQYRLIGYENRALREEDFTNDAVDAGDIGAGHQVTALYEIVPAGGKGWTPERRYAGNRISTPASIGPEAAFVKLRYKAPDGSASREIDRAVPASAITRARTPTGDMAFVTAVAAYGQKLRGDTYLGVYGYADIRRLAGSPQGYWRSEFVKLTELAEAGRPIAAR